MANRPGLCSGMLPMIYHSIHYYTQESYTVLIAAHPLMPTRPHLKLILHAFFLLRPLRHLAANPGFQFLM